MSEGCLVSLQNTATETWRHFESGDCFENFSSFSKWKKAAMVVAAFAVGVFFGALLATIPYAGSVVSVPFGTLAGLTAFAYLTKPNR